MFLRIRVLWIFTLCTLTMAGQDIDSLSVHVGPDTLTDKDSMTGAMAGQDTIPMDSVSISDSLSADSIRPYRWPLSDDAIDALVDYGGRDSMLMDNTNRLVHIYGEAYVHYGSLKLTADYIRLDLNTNVALAEGILDSAGELTGTPVFNDGGQEIKAERMRYNFRERKGMVYHSSTTQSDLFVHGKKTKFYGKGVHGREDDVIYNENAIFTTCDHPIPHFGIRSKKQKVVPKKVGVIGPSNLEIAGVPTPLWLPFGFFPMKIGKRGGLMFPNNYQYSNRWGYGLNNVGYYFPISDHFDFTLLTDLYFRGSYAIKGDLRYKKRYRYKGELSLGYSDYQTENEVMNEETGHRELVNQHERSYSIRFRHNQDNKAHPYRTIGGSLNIEGGQYDRLNYNNARNVLNNALNSNLSITQRFAGTPFTASLGLRHSQNNRTRDMTMTLPNLNIRMNQVFPFKRKRRIGPERWYEKISLGYNSKLKYDVRGVDSTFFSEENFSNGKFGIEQNLSTNVNFNVLKYFQLSPFVNYQQTMYTKATRRFFVNDLDVRIDTLYNEDDSTDSIIIRDTVSYGRDSMHRFSQFNTIHEYNAGISLFTKIYGTINFKKGRLRGLRHTVKPSISLSYSPDYTRPELGYFDRYVSTRNDGRRDTITYSRFQNENFGSPSTGRRFALNYSLLNLFEAKLFNKKDSTFTKSNILDNLSISGSYNFIADSLHWSPIAVSGNLRLFKGVATIKIRSTFDPYAINERGQRINTFEKDVSGNILRFDNASLSLNSGMSIRQFRDLLKRNGQGSKGDKTSLLSLFDKLRLTYQLTVRSERKVDDRIIFKPSVHSIAIRGDIPLSPKWNLNINNLDYNFARKASSYPDLGISRDLHCWTMGVSWQPERATYNFYIRVKPGSLDFINVPYRRNRADGFDDF